MRKHPNGATRRKFLSGLGILASSAALPGTSALSQIATITGFRTKTYARGAKVPSGLRASMFRQNIAATTLEKGLEVNEILRDALSQSYVPSRVPGGAVPSRFDWRDQNMVTPIRDQGFCGSCFIFGSLAAFESAYLIANKGSQPALDANNLEVSEQELLDCGISEADCVVGGWHDFVFTYLQLLGAVNEESYRYNEYASQRGVYCVSNWGSRIYFVRSWNYVSALDMIPSVQEIKSAIQSTGPVVCGVNALARDVAPNKQASWDDYRGGVIDSVASNGKSEDVNHDVAIIGWDDTLKGNGVSPGAWIVKNSWGTDWGAKGTVDAGYIFVPYNRNNIGFGASWVKAWSAASLKSIANVIEAK